MKSARRLLLHCRLLLHLSRCAIGGEALGLHEVELGRFGDVVVHFGRVVVVLGNLRQHRYTTEINELCIR